MKKSLKEKILSYNNTGVSIKWISSRLGLDESYVQSVIDGTDTEEDSQKEDTVKEEHFEETPTTVKDQINQDFIELCALNNETARRLIELNHKLAQGIVSEDALMEYLLDKHSSFEGSNLFEFFVDSLLSDFIIIKK